MASKAGYGPLAVLVAVNVLNFYDRHVLGALTEPIRKDFGLTDSQVGLIGSAFIWLYAIVGVPLGRAADSLSRTEPVRGASEAQHVTAHSSRLEILKIPTMWWIIVSGALLNFNMYAIATFLPAFLSRIHKLTLADSGIASGAIFAVGGVAGG